MFTKSKMAPVNISQNDYRTLLFHYVFCVLPFWGGKLVIAQESEKGGNKKWNKLLKKENSKMYLIYLSK
jgi:hypothetical protein